jgi:fatty acid desaturase
MLSLFLDVNAVVIESGILRRQSNVARQSFTSSSARRRLQSYNSRMRSDELPLLDFLGRDLLAVGAGRRVLSLATPLLLAIAFFLLAARGLWIGAIACTMLLSFVTYGSTSHDLVHSTLRLPRTLNEVLLCAIKLISFRNRHAYRDVHLNHHARFPAADDLEGAAATSGLPCLGCVVFAAGFAFDRQFSNFRERE